jgi:hypothetical protein
MVLKLIKDKLINEWEDLFKAPRPKGIYPMVLFKGPTRCNIYFFSSESKKPFAFAKTAQMGTEEPGCKNEFLMLRHLQKHIPSSMKDTIPAPLFELTYSDSYAMVERAFAGIPLPSIRVGEGIKWKKNNSLADDVVDWWFSLKQTFLFDNPFSPQDILQKVSEIKTRYIATFPNETANQKEMETISNYIEKNINEFKDCNSFVHGDFWKSNLLFDHGRMFVLDWERSRLSGFAIFDIFLFCATLLNNPDSIESFSYIFAQDNPINHVSTQMIKKASKNILLGQDQVFSLFELFLFEMASQGLLHFKKQIPWDEAWNNKLHFFLKNKDKIRHNSFS